MVPRGPLLRKCEGPSYTITWFPGLSLCLPPSDILWGAAHPHHAEGLIPDTPTPWPWNPRLLDWSTLSRNRKLAQVVWVQFLYFSCSDFPHSDPLPPQRTPHQDWPHPLERG